MTLGIVGQKCGMSRVFTELGESIPVTVVLVKPNHVTQIKSLENDGYTAVQVAYGEQKASRLNKPTLGHYGKAKVEPGRSLHEFRVADVSSFELGQPITVEQFSEKQIVDVLGTSKGKGFAGVVKRHNFKTQDASHGNSLSHRAAGSTGQCQTPGRVFKGKKMAGQMGNKFVTVQGLEVVSINLEQHLIMIKGSIPGPTGGRVVVKPTKKGGGDQDAA
jgi:large subunit ribosomal protein L3